MVHSRALDLAVFCFPALADLDAIAGLYASMRAGGSSAPFFFDIDARMIARICISA